MVRIRERKKDETRRRLSEEAMRLFERDGVERVTVADIAAAANVGKGTLYNYFRCKEDILVAFLRDIEAKALASIAKSKLDGRTLAEILNAAAWKLLQVQAKHYTYTRAVMARLVGGDAAFMTRTARFQGAIHAAFAEMFWRLQEAKLIAESWDADDLALRFTVMHVGLSSVWAMEGPPFTGAAAHTRAQTEIFARGIAP